MRRWIGLLAALILITSVLVGCSASGVSIDEKKGEVTIKNEKGETMSITANEDGKVPAGFDLPVYPGAVVTDSVETKVDGVTGYTLTFEVKGDPKAIGDFYAEALEAKGVKLMRMQDGATVVLTGSSETHTTMVGIEKLEDEELTEIFIMWGPKGK